MQEVNKTLARTWRAVINRRTVRSFADIWWAWRRDRPATDCSHRSKWRQRHCRRGAGAESTAPPEHLPTLHRRLSSSTASLYTSITAEMTHYSSHSWNQVTGSLGAISAVSGNVPVCHTHSLTESEFQQLCSSQHCCPQTVGTYFGQANFDLCSQIIRPVILIHVFI